MKIKKIIFYILIVISMFLITKVDAKEKVKVYIFEAGGCPYCEAEIEYLEKLPSYNEKFEIIRKETYIDHIEWEEGKDYDLTVKVVDIFKDAGFNEVSYHGTPLIIISNIYASSTYSTELESIIDYAYENGDVDVVSCIEKNENNCLKDDTTYDEEKTQNENNSNDLFMYILISIILVTLVIVLLILCKNIMNYRKNFKD